VSGWNTPGDIGGGRALAAAAIGLVGSRFRLRGRDPATGLDCIGVFACAMVRAGFDVPVPADYELRMRDLAIVGDWARMNGFIAVSEAFRAGDVALFALGAGQGHIAIAVGDGEFVHAHAGLRRVVRARIPDEWRLAGHWRPGATAGDGREA
jgi:cell wall-associated NlpC family hydrolase